MTTRSPELIEFSDEMERRSLRPGTIGKRMSVLVRCEIALDHPLIESTHLELRDWLDSHKLVAKTRYSYISHLSAFWTWALIEEVATKNPVLRLSKPKLRQGLPRPVSVDDVALLIDQSPTAEIRAMVILAGHVGLRCMEIAGLVAADVGEHMRPPAIMVAHGKGDKPRVVPISPTTIEALHAHGIPSHGAVFIDADGKALTPWKVSHMLREHIHKCGVAASAHQLRHSFGTEVYQRSHDLRLTQGLMGHSNPSTTAGYTVWSQDHAADIINTIFT